MDDRLSNVAGDWRATRREMGPDTSFLSHAPVRSIESI